MILRERHISAICRRRLRKFIREYTIKGKTKAAHSLESVGETKRKVKTASGKMSCCMHLCMLTNIFALERTTQRTVTRRRRKKNSATEMYRYSERKNHWTVKVIIPLPARELKLFIFSFVSKHWVSIQIVFFFACSIRVHVCVCCSRDERHLFGDEPLLFTFVNFSLCIHSSCCFFWGAYFPPTLVNNSTENNAHYGHKKETIILCVACLFSLAKRRIWVNRAHTVRAFSFSQFAEK